MVHEPTTAWQLSFMGPLNPLAQIPDAKGSKELMAMFRTLTRQPITVPVASLRIAKAKYDMCQTPQAGKHNYGACLRDSWCMYESFVASQREE